MKRTRHRRGFVLVLALALIALVGLLLCGAARHSLRRSLEAIDAEDLLQRRWGSISAQRVMLTHVETFFPNPVVELESTEVVTALIDKVETPLSLTVELGKFQFRIVFADEDAKVNLNTMHREFSPASVSQTASSLARGGSGSQHKIALRPGRVRPGDVNSKAFETWEQIFDLASSKAEKLFAASRQLPNAKLADLLNRLLIRERPRQRLESLLTDHSTSFSIWINMFSEKGSWNEFHVFSAALSSDADDRLDLRSIADFSW